MSYLLSTLSNSPFLIPLLLRFLRLFTDVIVKHSVFWFDGRDLCKWYKNKFNCHKRYKTLSFTTVIKLVSAVSRTLYFHTSDASMCTATEIHGIVPYTKLSYKYSTRNSWLWNFVQTICIFSPAGCHTLLHLISTSIWRLLD